jgi:hypothetical protein
VNVARGRVTARTVLAVIAAAGLAYDAYAHFDLAGTYDAIRTSTLSQGDLFRTEGGAAVLVALAILVRPRRYTALLAFAVAASALAAVLIYRYSQLGPIGPIPSMYEPAWYPEKTHSAWAEALAALASAGVFVLAWRPRDASSSADSSRKAGPDPAEAGGPPRPTAGRRTGER